MNRIVRLRRPLAALAFVAALLAPLPARAEEPLPPAEESPIGVIFAVICGASIHINRQLPGLPIVVVVGAAACLGMLVDAMATPDGP